MNKAEEPIIKIPILDLKTQYRRIGTEIRQALDEILDSQAFILGPVVQKFEERVASYLQCHAAIGVASGSDALLLSLMALGIGKGDGVLVPSFTFFSTVSCISRLGATPLFVDIDPETYLIDPRGVEDLLKGRFRPHPEGQGFIDPKTRCRVKVILPAHLFGQCCSMAPLVSVADKHRLHIVEDVAQAYGARFQIDSGISKAAGTAGDLGCFSFFPTKTLGGIGDGGLVATDQSPLADKIRMLRVHGQGSKYHHQTVGINSRLDVIQAAVLQVKMRYLDQWCDERIQRADLYHSLLLETGLIGDQIITIPPLGDGKRHVFNCYVIRVQRRDELRQYLGVRGIQTQVYYPLPLHLQPCFEHLGYHKGDFPNAELVASQVVALPIYPELTLEQQELVVGGIADFYRK
ncbi:MAG: DegT/DnrJ/EryC1/StrS family aminotransferase [Candidatus Binatia bacterium]